ncbi:MAG: hypothetical protein OEV40_17705 [Acidimicrobiia bacterium]|nr:hypothetical protein [Acidimicrobiia bacterium]
MTAADRRALVEAIHATPVRLVLAVAGGGNAVITDLLDVPGASRTVLEICVPYSERSLLELVATAPEPPPAAAGFVSDSMAAAMAAACLNRATALGQPGDTLVGVACTAALVSDRPKKGDHRAHVAVASSDGLEERLVDLAKGALDRAGEDRLVADAVLGAVADACGVG